MSETMERLLDYCSEKVELGIITNGPSAHQWNKVRSLQAERWIPHENIFVSGDVGAEKPDKKIFDHAKRMMKLEDAEIIPSHGYLVTRGLSDAVKRLSRDSGLGVKIYVDKIPFPGKMFDLGKEMNIDPVSAALNGGEDYRLLFTVPIGRHDKFRHDFQTFDIIGHLARPEVGTVLVTPEGVELPLKAQGW